jgi:hypothetical protein
MVGGQRLAWFRHWLKSELSKGCDVVVIEDVVMGVGAVKVLCEFIGVLKCTIAERQATHPEMLALIVNNQHLKQFACGTARADKPAMVRAADKQFPGVIADDVQGSDNEADALWLAEVGWHVAANITASNEVRREVVSKYRAIAFPEPKRKPAVKSATVKKAKAA